MAESLRPSILSLCLGGPVLLLLATGALAQTPPSTDGTETTPTRLEPVSPPTESVSSKVALSADMTAASRYLFQGFDYSEGRPVIQPNVALQIGSVTANVWGNYHVDRRELDEIDLSIRADHSLGKLSIATGYVSLQYPNRMDWEPSQEIFLDLGLEAALSPTLSVHHDFDAGNGTYSVLGLTHSIGSSLSLATNAFYLARYYGQTGFSALEVKSSWERSVGAYTFTPSISHFVTWTNGDFKDDEAVPSNWVFALSVGHAF
jgi:hypothetical protein